MSMAVNGSPKQVPIRREELAIVYTSTGLGV